MMDLGLWEAGRAAMTGRLRGGVTSENMTVHSSKCRPGGAGDAEFDAAQHAHA